MLNFQVNKPKRGGEKKSSAAKKLREKSAEGCLEIDKLFLKQAATRNFNDEIIDSETEISTRQTNSVTSHDKVPDTAKIGNNLTRPPENVTVSKNLSDHYESVENNSEDINYKNIDHTVENKVLEAFNYFKKSSNKVLEFFIANHPKQFTSDSLVQK